MARWMDTSATSTPISHTRKISIASGCIDNLCRVSTFHIESHPISFSKFNSINFACSCSPRPRMPKLGLLVFTESGRQKNPGGRHSSMVRTVMLLNSKYELSRLANYHTTSNPLKEFDGGVILSASWETRSQEILKHLDFDKITSVILVRYENQGKTRISGNIRNKIRDLC